MVIIRRQKRRDVGIFVECWWEYKIGQPHLKTIWRFFKHVNTDLPSDAVIPFQGTCSRKLKAHELHMKTCTLILIAALFMVAKKVEIKFYQVVNG